MDFFYLLLGTFSAFEKIMFALDTSCDITVSLVMVKAQLSVKAHKDYIGCLADCGEGQASLN